MNATAEACIVDQGTDVEDVVGRIADQGSVLCRGAFDPSKLYFYRDNAERFFGFVEFKPDGHAGLAILHIANAGSMYNQLPGNIATIELSRHPAMGDMVALGVRLDPDLTYLRDEAGQIIPTVIEDVVVNRPYWSAPSDGDAKTGK